MIDATDIHAFDRLTGTDLLDYTEAYGEFVEESLPRLEAFFKGRSEFVDGVHAARLKSLQNDSATLRRQLTKSAHLIVDSRSQDIAYLAEDMLSDVAMFARVDKFSRSTTRLPSTTHGVVVGHTIPGGTLENVARTRLGATNPEDRWVEIARYNDLYEVDYDYDGGERVDLIYPLASAGGAEEAVLDYMFTENILGKDIHRAIRFEDQDIIALAPEPTFVQSVEILTDLEKGDIPEFPRMGRTSFVGTSASVFAYASLTRQLHQTFLSDATVSKLRINGYALNEGDVTLDFSVGNIRDEVAVEQTISI